MSRTPALNPGTDGQAPALRRRLACFVYESLLVFAVFMGVGLAYGIATQQRHALQGSAGLGAALFAALGIYFVWFWTHGGQTVAMKTWRIRVVDTHGQPLQLPRAVARYLLAWLWFLPALALTGALGLDVLGGAGFTVVLLTNLLAYAALARLHPQRQFWHDAACGSRLVATEAAGSTAAAS